MNKIALFRNKKVVRIGKYRLRIGPKIFLLKKCKICEIFCDLRQWAKSAKVGKIGEKCGDRRIADFWGVWITTKCAIQFNCSDDIKGENVHASSRDGSSHFSLFGNFFEYVSYRVVSHLLLIQRGTVSMHR